MSSDPPQTTTHPDVPPFPSPSTFSILPDIYLLLARLNVLQQQQQQQQQQAGATSAASSAPPLDLKDLPAQVYPIKQRIAKAKAAVQALPDVERTVEEQEREIRDLERTATLLKRRIGKLGGIAAGKHDENEQRDVVMKGVED